MEETFNKGNLIFYDFFSFPHNPENLFTLLYLLYKKETYEIYKGIFNETRDVFCIKIIPLDKNGENSSKSLFQKIKEETLIMKSFKNCENITHYYGSFLSFISKSVWLIYEYCPVGSTYDLMEAIDRPLTEEEISIIMNDIIHGLTYMHQLNIIHRNIKITNILLNGNGNAKLNNFSKSFQKLNSSNEIFINQKDEINDFKYDILLLGITCIELFKGVKDNSFYRKKFLEKIKKSKNQNLNINEEIELFLNGKNNNGKCADKQFIEFIQRCTEPNPYKRPTAFELSNHSFIKKSANSTYKTHFINIIKESIEKIENNKKENYYSLTSKQISDNFYKNIYCNTKNTVNSNISNNEKNSINISNIINKTNDVNITNVDKLAEFRIEQMKKEEEIEYDKFTNKDLYYSDISDSNNNTLRESSVLGKREVDKSCKIQKKSLLRKKQLKKEEKEDITQKEGQLSIKKDNDEIDFKAKWEHLNKYEELFKNKLSEDNKNLDYNHKMIFSDDDSININNNFGKNNNSIIINNNNNIIRNIEENKPKPYIPFSEIKCDIIQLGSPIKKSKSKKSNNTSEYSLKNSLNKSGENNNCIDNKDNNLINLQKKFLLLSFGNSSINEYDKKMDINIKDKNSKIDMSTCFSSFNSPICNKVNINGGMMDVIVENNKTCEKIIHLNKNNYEDNVIYNDNYCYGFYSERAKHPFLYKFINDDEKPKEYEINNKKTNIIKIDKIFKNKNIKDISLDKNIKDVVIK